jgi:hypothetical protein
MSNVIFEKVFPVILLLILLLLFIILGGIGFYRWGKEETLKEIKTEEKIENAEHEEYIDFTEVMLDKRTFMCRGDVDLNVNEIGVVTFTCYTEDEKLTFTLNPVEMFVTRHWAKRGVNDMGTVEEESE